MKIFTSLIYVAFAFGLIAFAYTLWRQTYSKKKPGAAVRRTAANARPTAITSGEMLKLIPKLRDSNAQWAEIMRVLNPRQDIRINELLQTIRGPHMFDPRTALGVIETGCRATTMSGSAFEALA
ncbi:MAG: hypothetical protein KGM91_07410, partial [Burkholderiales bacterium]|nr:hypothetical protein [Burkholderiales bacterium]